MSAREAIPPVDALRGVLVDAVGPLMPADPAQRGALCVNLVSALGSFAGIVLAEFDLATLEAFCTLVATSRRAAILRVAQLESALAAEEGRLN